MKTAKSAIPSPNSCAICGSDERNHAMRWSREVGYHNYLTPTGKQRLERMKARSNLS